MKIVLAATIKAIFVVMGEPNVAVRQCPLAMDKWLKLVISPKQTMLGLIIDTNRLTIANPAKYLQEVLNLLNSTCTLINVVSKCQKPRSSLEN
jgi:hypothetical protein